MTLSRLRQYVIAHKLGEGGMGVVWKARDTTLERDVALKVLPAEGAASETRRERFFREARAASALNHPNIITVYEINSDGETDFIAMELVEGETLSARIGRGPMRIDDVLAIARQIAEAVSRAHRAGIVHRDLKPGNVMINHDGLVKVLDFGLAKVGAHKTDEERTGEETRLALTREGTALGTMGYMSPEQALGDPADARSDVFSFGVIVYQMLAGTLPFQGHTNTELLRALHFGEPKPLADVRPDAPAWLAGIVAKSLAKDPKNRFADMGAAAAALRDPVSVQAPAPVETPGRQSRTIRRRRVRASSGLAIASAVVFSAYALVPWERLRGNRAGESVATTLADASPADITQRAAELLIRFDRPGNIDRAIALLDQAIAADADYATAYAHLGSAYLAKNRETPDPQWMKLAQANVERAVELNRDLAVAHAALGVLHQDAGRPDEARAAFERAVDLDPLNARALGGLAKLHDASNREAEAVAAYDRAIAANSGDWRVYLERGAFHYRRGRFSDATADFERARELTPDNVDLLRNLGASLYMQGRPDEASSRLQEALAIREDGPVYTNLANIRFFQGRYAEAAQAFEKALKLNANNSLTWGNLGDAYRWTPGRRPEAAGAYTRALQLLDAQIAARPGDVNLRTRRAGYLAKKGDARAALDELRRLGTDVDLTGQMLVRVATVHELAGDRDRALEAIDRAFKKGYPPRELAADPELTGLRADARYHRLAAAVMDVPSR